DCDANADRQRRRRVPRQGVAVGPAAAGVADTGITSFLDIGVIGRADDVAVAQQQIHRASVVERGEDRGVWSVAAGTGLSGDAWQLGAVHAVVGAFGGAGRADGRGPHVGAGLADVTGDDDTRRIRHVG